MALKSETTTLATIQMRRGREEDFDPHQMTAGEWAVSTDSKKVWMCFRPGLCLRMATYEAFEQDMEEIRTILVEAKDIQKAIEKWNYLAESYAHGGTGEREGEETDNAKYYSEQAKLSADKAEALSDIGIMTTEKAGIGKPDGTTITADEDGTLRVIGGGAASGDFASKSIYGDNAISFGRLEGSEVGNKSIAYGDNLIATGFESVNFGQENQTTDMRSVAFGFNNKSSAANSFSCGKRNQSSGKESFTSGGGNIAIGNYSSSVGCGNISLGSGSHAENCQNIAGAKYVFKIESYDVEEKKFTFDDTYEGFSYNFSILEAGSQLFVQNVYYIDTASTYTVSAKGSDGKSVTVNEDIPTSNYSVLYATLIKIGNDNYGGVHAEGGKNVALNSYAHAEGYMTEARGYCSHTEGGKTKATANRSHSEGYNTKATGDQSHSEGFSTTASGYGSHVEGYLGTASGRYSHAEGRNTNAKGDYSHAEGYDTRANGKGTHTSGKGTLANGDFSSAFGNRTYTYNYASFVCGKYGSIGMNTGSEGNTEGVAFCIGGGYYGDDNEEHSSNAFSVRYSGVVKAKSTITASTIADYAEFFEWFDGNTDSEDRVGKFVTIDGNKIKIAKSGDYILGIVSGAPFVLGNGDCDMWNGAYLRDDFGRIIYEPAPKIEIDEGTGEAHIVVDKNGDTVFFGTRPMINPEYDPSREYISREDRPEWDAVGMLGVLPVLDDGTCEVGRFCKCADGGIATLATERGFDTYMVIERVTENVVSVVFK